MTSSDSFDHEDVVVDCGYTKVIACRVGALGASLVRSARPGDLTCLIRDSHPRGDSTAVVPDIYVPRSLRAKLREFTLKELGKATSNFSLERMVGCGGLGPVFKGTLSDGAAVAVKVLGKDSSQGLGQFQAEMTVSYLITRSSYTNLVPAIGYHSSRKRKKVKVMLVYPFMVNKDIGRYLNDRKSPRSPLNWPTRKRIALGVARGISSLHELGIIRLDIKPSNVLLDEDFNAYVGDLGIAKSIGLPHDSYEAAEFCWGKDRSECINTTVMGTSGFADPEYLISGRCSRKSDVYSFGVTLIQLVTGLPVVDRSKNRADIVWRAEQLLKNKEDLTRHMHPDMLGMHDESEAIELLRLGLICTQHSRKRPLMPEVIAIMEGNNYSLMRRWDNYNYGMCNQQWLSENRSEGGASGSGSGDDDHEEASSSLELDINDEELEVNQIYGNQPRLAEDPASEMAAYNPLGEDATSLTEIVEVDPDGGGNSKPLSSRASPHYEGQSDEVATKLGELLDQMRAMEEMQGKQIGKIESMMKMQEECIQKVNDMQSQVDGLKEASASQKLLLIFIFVHFIFSISEIRQPT